MNNLSVVVGGMVIVVLLAVTGLLVTQVGGAAIRSASLTHGTGTLELASSKLLPGVPVTVGVGEEIAGRGQSAALLLRLPTGSIEVGEVDLGQLQEGTFRVVVPCGGNELAGAAARLILVDRTTQAVLAQSGELTLLPPGPDCLFSD